ncbi:biotin--[acetyl-CoA-carboxylase] ligase [Fulvivirga sediminis]|uniref:Biotin--[acetyl-CoA-carboxylase] ligase n=1 Tax=Fulvivirga sediminis TaxID=2803949 RepID=A0A937K1J7_9BACT|nr:biotin--[acetyl-CoA-carboxylase] ligase [Fulvivirga sediminis]MBL3656742.1 biotin--[acetyl-CoA-carboxylase] ligase [Fulvivirga sediminis]
MYKILAKTLFIGKNLVFLPSCHSTNDIAQELLSEGTLEGTVIITENQTNGRGQRGSGWESEPGKNLTFSLVLKPTFLSVQQQFELNRVVSLAVCDFLNTFSTGFQVKWPNDIYYHDRKICGILIQNSIRQGRIESSIVGIGLNINQQIFKEQKPISLSRVTGEFVPLPEALEALAQHIETRYLTLKAGNRERLHKDYLHKLYRFGEEYLYRANGELFNGRITDVSPEGKLEVESKKGIQQFDFKEVEFII